ncbi:MAG: hypothetical protein NBV63_02070 [Candidatus Pacebacteria bacterium]|jgi:uncharacterized protein YoxC|nr:hypothetical protein [Candidatus Paceibacterota bacterium]
MVRQPTPVETFFERLTSWIGSIPSLLVHTLVFASAFLVAVFGYAPWDMVLLVVTTVVSLEAIYLAIFIQMTVNRQARELHDVSEDVEEISKEVEEISVDVEEMSHDVEEIGEDVEEIQADVEEMSEDWDLETGKSVADATTEDLQRELERIKEKLRSRGVPVE